MAEEHMRVGKNGEIMQIWCERNKVFKEKPEPAQIFHHKSHSH